MTHTVPDTLALTFTNEAGGEITARLRRPLTDIQLSLGESVTTSQPQLPRGLAEPQACITKQQGQVKFCVVPVDWPEAMEEAFSVNTLLYQGTRAIARSAAEELVLGARQAQIFAQCSAFIFAPEYFAPLQAWLKKQNKGRSCGW